MQDLHAALKMLGLNPLEQEVLDLTNEVARNGLIYFPEFCQIVTKKYREEDQEVFRQNMFKVQTFYHLFYLSLYEHTFHPSFNVISHENISTFSLYNADADLQLKRKYLLNTEQINFTLMQ